MADYSHNDDDQHFGASTMTPPQQTTQQQNRKAENFIKFMKGVGRWMKGLSKRQRVNLIFAAVSGISWILIVIGSIIYIVSKTLFWVSFFLNAGLTAAFLLNNMIIEAVVTRKARNAAAAAAAAASAGASNNINTNYSAADAGHMDLNVAHVDRRSVTISDKAKLFPAQSQQNDDDFEI